MTKVAPARTATVLAGLGGLLADVTRAVNDTTRAAAVAWLDDPTNWGEPGRYTRPMVQLAGSDNPDPGLAELCDLWTAWDDAVSWPDPGIDYALDELALPSDEIPEHAAVWRRLNWRLNWTVASPGRGDDVALP